MRAPTALLAALLLLAATPAASAGLFTSEPVRVTVPETRVGDLLRYEAWQSGEDEEEALAETLVVKVEGPTAAVDRFGVARDTDAFLVQRTIPGEDGHVTVLDRCHALRGGVDTVRRDVLVGWGASGAAEASQTSIMGLAVEGEATTRVDNLTATFPDAPCAGRDVLAGRTLEEGDTLRLADLGIAGLHPADALSEPATPAKLHGRPALLFRFRVNSEQDGFTIKGTLDATVADGLPGAARLSFDGTIAMPEWEATTGMTWACDVPPAVGCSGNEQRQVVPAQSVAARARIELTGVVRGDGAPLAPLAGKRLPDRSPDAEPVAFLPRVLDDAALRLAFPFADALASLEADPTVKLASFLTEHPDAVLVVAEYDRRMRAPGADSADTDGGWTVVYAAGDEARCAISVRVTGARSPLGPLAAPVKVVRNHDCGGDSFTFLHPPPTLPSTVAPSAAVAAAAARHGVAAGTVERLAYYHGAFPWGGAYHALELSQVSRLAPEESPAAEGLTLDVDPATGGLLSVRSTTVERQSLTLLGPSGAWGGVTRDDPNRALGLLAGVPAGAGLAGGAAAVTGLALLALAAKFLLIPLFTRLRRDRLLDNPVRARLHEHVRANPGVHSAELVDLTGIGEGATRHHLAQLVRHGLLFETRDGGYVRYFVAGDVPPAMARREAVLRAGSNRRVFEALTAEPHLSLREVGARLGMSAPSVHRSVKRLRAAGLLPEPGDLARR